MPPPRVRLAEPGPLGLRSRPRRDTAASGDTATDPPALEQVVGAPIPTAADPAPDFAQASTRWRNSLGAAIER
jgi:hypothetical protein